MRIHKNKDMEERFVVVRQTFMKHQDGSTYEDEVEGLSEFCTGLGLTSRNVTKELTELYMKKITISKPTICKEECFVMNREEYDDFVNQDLPIHAEEKKKSINKDVQELSNSELRLLIDSATVELKRRGHII